MEPLIFERSTPGHRGFTLPAAGVPGKTADELLPPRFLRAQPPELPEVHELDVVRHFTRLSHLNHAITTGFYPLGSCTMKYNPPVNDAMAQLDGFAQLHPYQPEDQVQGALQLLYELEGYLKAITGLARVCLQPAAGAHGELTGILVIKAYHRHRGDKRNTIIVPDSAHGTNPASAALAGFKTVTVKSNDRGLVDVEALRGLLNEDVAALMLTNPNTLGLFEEDILTIREMVHKVGGILYYDGANLNAIVGTLRPGDMGFDVVHLNLHKTFSTPHGGGGPGAGPVAVRADLAPFLPVPTIERSGDRYYLDYNRPQSIGKIRAFYGNFGILVRAYTYIRSYGAAGLRQISEDAVLNANYVRSRLRPWFDIPHDRTCMHEFVLSGNRQKRQGGVNTMAMAKRLMDFGIHPPTIYFPLIVPESMMIEPTETESKATLDNFVDVMHRIAEEAEKEPDKVLNAPYTTPIGRVDEVTAARKPNLRWRPGAAAPVRDFGSIPAPTV